MLILRKLALLLAATLASTATLATNAAPAVSATAVDAPRSTRAVMTGEQVVQILDETVDWYRTLGAQQQSATQPSDLLILYANRQTADKVINLAFEIARANAELLSSEADLAQKTAETGSSAQTLIDLQKQLDQRRTALQTEIASLQGQAASGPKGAKGEAEIKIEETQSELDLVNARRNMVSTMSQFVYQSSGS